MIRTTVRAAAAAPVWEFRDPHRLSPDAGVDSYRFNAALRFARGKGRYPYNLDVVVPFRGVDKAGRPTEAEIDRLADIEEKAVAIVGDRGVLAGARAAIGRVRNEGAQVFVFYTDSPDWTAKPFRGATGVGNLGVNCDPDPRWHHYRDMRGGWGQDPPTLKDVEVVGLGLAALAFYGAVQAAYHGAWGPGGLAVIIVLIAARRLGRYRLRQSPLRPALTFGGYAMALSAFVFALLAIGRVPAWIALVAGLLAGPALAAGGRLGRRRGIWPRRAARFSDDVRRWPR
jgi:hypothetical protein